jgi:hypothetical protein
MNGSFHSIELGESSFTEVELQIPQSVAAPPVPSRELEYAPGERPLPIRFASPNEAEIAEFARLYLEEFGVELSIEDAAFVATKYIHMFQILTYE